MTNTLRYTAIKADYIFGPFKDSLAIKYMLLNNGIIENISDSIPVCQEMRQFDFTGYSISPLFCDHHLHFSYSALASSCKIAETLLQNGIRKCFEGGDSHLSGMEMKKLLKDRLEVRTAGYAIHKKGTYGKFIGKSVESFRDARELIDQLQKRGADYIKIINSGIFNAETAEVTPGGFEKEELAGIVTYAKEHGLDIFCHVNGAAKIRESVSAGVSVIIHGLYVSDETLSMMAENKVAFIPTVNAFEGLSDITSNRETKTNISRAVQGHLMAIKEAADKGVRVLPGSDSGPHFIPHGAGLHKELGLFKKAGLKDEYIISSAIAGQFRAGMEADFLVLKGIDIENIYIRGKCLKLSLSSRGFRPQEFSR